MRFRIFAALAVVLMVSSPLAADEPAPVVITIRGDRAVRVLVSEGLTRPCESRENRPMFDRLMGPGEVARASIGSDCICIQHTSPSFPSSDWATPGLVCRPRVCRGRVCRPAPDPTIRVWVP